MPAQPCLCCASALSAAEYRTGEAFWAGSDLVRRSGGEAGPGAFVVLSGVIRRVHQLPDGTTKVGWMWRAGGSRLPCVASHLVAAFLAAADCPASVCSSDLLVHWLQEYFQGIGGVVGSLLAMTGAHLHLHLHLLRWHPQAGLMDGVGTTSRLARHAAHLGLRQGSAASSQLPVLNPHLALPCSLTCLHLQARACLAATPLWPRATPWARGPCSSTCPR